MTPVDLLASMSAFRGVLDEVDPPTSLPTPSAGPLPQGLSMPERVDEPKEPSAPLPPWAAAALLPTRQSRPPPQGLTLWLEEAPTPPPPTTLPQALWHSVFEAGRGLVLAHHRTLVDAELAKLIHDIPGRLRPRTEIELLQELLALQETVCAPHPATGEVTCLPAQDMPLNLGVSFLRAWVQPQLLPRFIRDTLDGQEAPGAQEFFDYVLMELANGEHFFDVATTVGVPVYAIMRFVRAFADGNPPRQHRLQQALDDGVDVATAAFARAADDPSVSEDLLERVKQALVARRDLILRLQDSRYAPPAALARAGMRVSAGGMQIDFTFDQQAPLPSTRFHKNQGLTVDVESKEVKG